MTKLRIVTRKSTLALWQANYVMERLQKIHKHLEVKIQGVVTEGDAKLEQPLAAIGGKGLFTKELETYLLEEKADIAVHSLKDMPVTLPRGLKIGAVLERQSPWDVLVSKQYDSVEALPKHAIVGTSSLRRQSQLLALRPDLQVTFLRGNVETRLKKVESGQMAAVVLAEAGLKRLGVDDTLKQIPFTREHMLPAIGQGVIAIECRTKDKETQHLITPMQHHATFQCVEAERAMNKKLGGGCHAPIGGYAEHLTDSLQLWGLVAMPDGKKILRASARAMPEQAAQLGEAVAAQLIEEGALELLAQLSKTKEPKTKEG